MICFFQVELRHMGSHGYVHGMGGWECADVSGSLGVGRLEREDGCRSLGVGGCEWEGGSVCSASRVSSNSMASRLGVMEV